MRKRGAALGHPKGVPSRGAPAARKRTAGRAQRRLLGQVEMPKSL